MRAEAAGLVSLAPTRAPAHGEDSQPSQDFAPADAGESKPVWWDGDDEKWRTSFPPPAVFYGEEDGAFGDPDYSRDLTAEEEDLVEKPYRAEVAARRESEGAARDRWFALLAAPDGEPIGAPAATGYTEPGAACGEGGQA